MQVDGRAGPKTIGAIETVQVQFGLRRIDGRVDPGGFTITALNRGGTQRRLKLPRIAGKTGLSDVDFENAARVLGCTVPAIRAVAQVEAAGSGYYPSGRPEILFEAHIFSRRTSHQFDKSHPKISSRAWSRSLYSVGESEYKRLELAMNLDAQAALESASWGRFQIMGFNYRSAGYTTLANFVLAMFQSEANHLIAFVNFIKAQGLAEALANKDWAAFAAGYNGPAYNSNRYDLKMREAYDVHSVNNTLQKSD